MPDVVILSAERTGMILPLCEWVLRQARQTLHQCPAPVSPAATSPSTLDAPST